LNYWVVDVGEKYNIPRITDPNFGLTFIESSASWKLVLGSHSVDTPFICEYFSVPKYKSKAAAKRQAQERRSELMRRADFKRYFKHQVDGRRIPTPRADSPVKVTGVIFAKGYTHSSTGTKANPRFVAYGKNVALGSYSLRKLTAEKAFHSAVKTRFAFDGRRYVKKDIDELFIVWLTDKEVLKFVEDYKIPIYFSKTESAK
jgi:hypothetical protein